MKIQVGDNCIINIYYLQKENKCCYVSPEYQNGFINLKVL